MLIGVSVNLSVTYLRPAAEGSLVTADARVVHVGKSLATIQVGYFPIWFLEVLQFNQKVKKPKPKKW